MGIKAHTNTSQVNNSFTVFLVIDAMALISCGFCGISSLEAGETTRDMEPAAVAEATRAAAESVASSINYVTSLLRDTSRNRRAGIWEADSQAADLQQSCLECAKLYSSRWFPLFQAGHNRISYARTRGNV
ncbi:hypothetical protein PIB30_031911 [Stylosanthes scabra]|uniref:Uncharacterized protein n=1 Tax=Stylosanthes scabra TaxID=79078 RepID=A0ABU6YAD7_9FABA|nr:hypothetical protein [Stylosanthes scabra]